MIVNNMKVIDACWYSEVGNYGCIGIVTVQDIITEEYKRYIGTGDGVDETVDTTKIVVGGAKFHPEIYM